MTSPRACLAVVSLGFALVYSLAFADPIDLTVPYDGKPTGTTGRLSFDNAREFRQYTLLLGKGFRIHPFEYYQKESVSLCAVPTALLDSVRHAAPPDSLLTVGMESGYDMMAKFLHNDPRILTAKWTPPPLPKLSYTLPHGGCKIIEDECHIARLDSAVFEVKPVRAIYGFVNMEHKVFTTLRLPYRNSSVRPEPNMLLLRIRYPGAYYGGLSAAFLSAFVAALVIARRRRKVRVKETCPRIFQ